MPDNTEDEEAAPAGSDEAQQDVAQAIGSKTEATSAAKAEAATSTATAGDELSDNDLEAVAGGYQRPQYPD